MQPINLKVKILAGLTALCVIAAIRACFGGSDDAAPRPLAHNTGQCLPCDTLSKPIAITGEQGKATHVYFSVKGFDPANEACWRSMQAFARANKPQPPAPAAFHFMDTTASWRPREKGKMYGDEASRSRVALQISYTITRQEMASYAPFGGARYRTPAAAAVFGVQ